MAGGNHALPPATLEPLSNQLATKAFAGLAAVRIRLKGESSAHVEGPARRIGKARVIASLKSRHLVAGWRLDISQIANTDGEEIGRAHV